MRTREAVEHWGGTAKLAEALGVNRVSVWKWGEYPPIDRQCQIEVISGGALQADRKQFPSTEVKAEAG